MVASPSVAGQGLVTSSTASSNGSVDGRSGGSSGGSGSTGKGSSDGGGSSQSRSHRSSSSSSTENALGLLFGSGTVTQRLSDGTISAACRRRLVDAVDRLTVAKQDLIDATPDADMAGLRGMQPLSMEAMLSDFILAIEAEMAGLQAEQEHDSSSGGSSRGGSGSSGGSKKRQ
jgi:hypothetical protein